MGDKYIIDLEDKPFHKEDGDFLYRVKGFNSLVFDMTDISKLAPYHEPDLEQVRKEAFENGYGAACKDIDIKSKTNAAYRKGLEDIWEAVRKVIHMPEADLLNLFTECYSAVCTPLQVFLKYDASECIEKIRQYEQEQKEFHVGDEFENESGKKFVVLKMNGKEIDRYIDSDGKTYLMCCKYKVMRKTGRRFPEVSALLEKMREDGNQNRIQETMSDDY